MYFDLISAMEGVKRKNKEGLLSLKKYEGVN